MFVVAKKDTTKLTPIFITQTFEQAEGKLITLCTEEKLELENVSREYKKFIKVIPGYLYGETREVIAEYYIMELSENNVKYQSEIKNEAYDYIIKVFTTERKEQMTFDEMRDISNQIELLDNKSADKLVSWCMNRITDPNIMNLLGYIYEIHYKAEKTAGKYFLEAAKLNHEIALANLKARHSYLIGDLVEFYKRRDRYNTQSAESSYTSYYDPASVNSDNYDWNISAYVD
jgi:hypothetical protein